jgi:hypothetical protein
MRGHAAANRGSDAVKQTRLRPPCKTLSAWEFHSMFRSPLLPEKILLQDQSLCFASP